MAWVKRLVQNRLLLISGRCRYYGTTVYFPKRCFVFDLLCQSGVYERENLQLLCRLARPGTSLFDVGGNIGLMSVPVLKERPDCRVVTFEPSPTTWPYLARTHRGSHHRGRWTIIKRALGRTPGEGTFRVCAPATGAYDGFRDTGRGGSSTTISIPVSTLDAEWKALGSPPVSVVKVDVEGAEIEVLEGASECMAQERPAVLLEWNVSNLLAYKCEPQSLLSFAEKVGYGVYAVPFLVPISSAAMLKLQMLRGESFLLFAE
jgi:FkbM family methyltransferase